jgi:hypothetical protein
MIIPYEHCRVTTKKWVVVCHCLSTISHKLVLQKTLISLSAQVGKNGSHQGSASLQLSQLHHLQVAHRWLVPPQYLVVLALLVVAQVSGSLRNLITKKPILVQ